MLLLKDSRIFTAGASADRTAKAAQDRIRRAFHHKFGRWNALSF